MKSTKHSLSIASVLIALQCGQAHAQDSRQIDEIVVTAQKRAQTLQDVPIAITAISGADLEKSETNTITDLAETVPGFTVNENNRPATSTSIAIRGIGTAGNDAALEGSVGVFLNGVYRPRSGMGLGDLVDVDSLEILRGPQGTLFGKNTSAGAVVIKTKDPVLGEHGAFAEATFGNFDLQKYSGMVNVGGETFAVRVSGQVNNRDGYIEDSVTGDTYNDRDRSYVLAKALWEPTDNVSLLLTGDIANNDDSCCQSVRLSNPDSPVVGLFAALAAGSGATYPVNPDPTSYTTSVNSGPAGEIEDKGVSLEVNVDLGNVSLTSITSKRQFESDVFNDVDFSGADLVTQTVILNVDSFTQELRLNGSLDGIAGGVDWLVGGFYSSDEFEQSAVADQGADLAPFFTVAFGNNPTLGGLYSEREDAFGADVDATAESFALFTHNIVSLTDRLDLTLGLRYTDEEKKTDQNTFFNHGVANLPFAGLGLPFAPQHSYNLTYEDDAVSGTASLGYALTDDIRTYASYNRGYKSGGHVFGRDAAGPLYSANPVQCPTGNVAFPGGVVPGIPTIFNCDPIDPTFDAETVDSYELGFRSKLLDRTLQLNVTAFYSEFEDYQLNNFDGFAFRVSNAGSATTKGVEVESLWLTPIEGLTLQGAVSYIDARFGDEVESLAAGEPVVGGELIGDSPEWSGTVGANYEASLSENITANFNASYSFRGETFTSTRVTSAGGELIIPSRDTLNASAGIQLPHGVGVSVFCRNCADSSEPVFAFNSVAQSGSKDVFLQTPQEYGISIRKDF